jgi:hypothetical protein
MNIDYPKLWTLAFFFATAGVVSGQHKNQQSSSGKAAAQQQQSQIPQKVDGNMMKEIGQAQAAAQKITMIVMDINSSTSRLTRTDRTKLPIPPSCPEVQQGSYAGPTCACEKARSVASENSEVNAENIDLLSLNQFINQNIPRIREQLVIIDKLETDYKYGEAVSDPNMKQIFYMVQTQGMTGFISIYNMAGGGWEQGAKSYAQYVNAGRKKCKN